MELSLLSRSSIRRPGSHHWAPTLPALFPCHLPSFFCGSLSKSLVPSSFLMATKSMLRLSPHRQIGSVCACAPSPKFSTRGSCLPSGENSALPALTNPDPNSLPHFSGSFSAHRRTPLGDSHLSSSAGPFSVFQPANILRLRILEFPFCLDLSARPVRTSSFPPFSEGMYALITPVVAKGQMSVGKFGLHIYM